MWTLDDNTSIAVDEISEFLNVSKDTVFNKIHREITEPGYSVAVAWKKASPVLPDAIKRFYQTTKSYIYDLSVETIKPTRIQWRDSILLYMSQYENKNTLLDYGGGIGTEAMFFANAGFVTTYYDLPGYTSEFAKYRLKRYSSSANICADPDELTSYDIITCLEVMEHLVDPIHDLQFLFSKLNPNGLVFLSESFKLVSQDYPAHLKSNAIYAKNLESILVSIGFSVIDKICDDRIYVLGKFPKVDIVIPTYNAYEHVRECLNSVTKNTKDVPYRLVLINDASTDDNVEKLYKKLNNNQNLYIKNANNLGFVKTANKGILASQENDVILLNTDTVVSPGWLSLIQRSIYKKENIATANPISNNASIYSIQELTNQGRDLSIKAIADIIRQSSMHLLPEVPVCVGFCMYIKREAIKKVGCLDEVFERGYGEESDFCMKCRKEGLVNVLVDDAFVFHEGHVSMLLTGDIKPNEASIVKHEKILRERYPDYNHIIDEFSSSGVMENIKHNILQNMTSYISQYRKRIMYFIHTPINGQNIGGTELHAKDLIRGLAGKYALYIVHIKEGSKIVVEEYIDNIQVNYLFDIPFAIPHYTIKSSLLFLIYKEIIDAFHIDLVHVHHLMNQSFDVIYAAKALGVPIIMTVHDYYLISPDYNLLYRLEQKGYYKNKLPTRKYFEDKYGLVGFNVNNWQQSIRTCVASIDLLVFPSHYAYTEIQKVYGSAIKNFKIIPHGTKTYVDSIKKINVRKANKNKFSVLFLGYVHASQKGGYIVVDTIRDLLKHGIEVHILGSSSAYWEEFSKHQSFVCHGSYDRDDVVALMKHINPNIIVIASPWPETFSYTYSEALQTNKPIVTFGIGAFIERSKSNRKTILVKTVTAKALTKKIVELSHFNDEYKKALKARESFAKIIEDNVEEYNQLYKDIFKTEGSFKANDTYIQALKKGAFNLYESYEKNRKNIKMLEVQIVDIEGERKILENSTKTLEEFRDLVKGSLYYRIYVHVRHTLMYRLLKVLYKYVRKLGNKFVNVNRCIPKPKDMTHSKTPIIGR